MTDIKKTLLRQAKRAEDAYDTAGKLAVACDAVEEDLRQHAYYKSLVDRTTEADMKAIKACMDKTHAALRKSMDCMSEIKAVLKDISGRD